MDPYRIAQLIAPKSEHRWAKHVALVVRGGAIVAVGYNHATTHAEASALNKLWPSERRDTRVWSMRLNRSGKFRMAKPCADCMRYLRSAGVKAVYWTNSEGDIESEKL